jgi:hypothetical protein
MIEAPIMLIEGKEEHSLRPDLRINGDHACQNSGRRNGSPSSR